MNVLSYFSPTGGTKRAVSMLAEAMGGTFTNVDLTNYEVRQQPISLTPSDLLIVGVPVYGGRLPAVDDLLDCFAGDHTPCIVCACFGNRDFDDALLELSDEMTARGFDVIAGCALVIPHVYSDRLGAFRPDELDKTEITAFAEQVRAKLSANDHTLPHIPGNRPYKEWNKPERAPQHDESCTSCGACAAVCPVRAIDKASFAADPTRCIQCMRCVRLCPEHARALDMSAIKEWLESLFLRRADNAFFL